MARITHTSTTRTFLKASSAAIPFNCLTSYLTILVTFHLHVSGKSEKKDVEAYLRDGTPCRKKIKTDPQFRGAIPGRFKAVSLSAVQQKRSAAEPLISYREPAVENHAMSWSPELTPA
jgi:hypothetical protein